MELQDAMLALLLTARIHRNDGAVKATAKRCARQLPRGERNLMYAISDSAHPLEVVQRIATAIS